MPRASFTLLLALVAGLWVGAASVQASDTTSVPHKAAQFAPALWIVEDDDTHIYLFGTIHFLKPAMNWFGGEVEAAFDSAEVAVFEALEPDVETAQQIVMSMAVRPASFPLRDLMNDAERTRYESLLEELGVPTSAFDRFDPWMAALQLALLPVIQAGYSPDSGADSVLTMRAEQAGKEIVGLESFEQQLGLLDDMTEESQLDMLNETVTLIAEQPHYMERMVRNWANGDAAALAESINETITDELAYDTLLTQRNIRWADWIARRMAEPGTVFVAVGAGHLAGADSVQAMLKTRGLEPRRIDQ